MDEAKRHAPATARNRDVIADVLRKELPERGLVLEIASGTGEHALHFAGTFPSLDWQPSDPDPSALASIAAWRAEHALANLREPLEINTENDAWPLAEADAIFCANMVHIAPWSAIVGLFKGGQRLLSEGDPLILYGPYFEESVEPAPSNLAFDESLKSRNPAWGIRHITQMDELARASGFRRSARYGMPANNLTLVYRKV